MSAKPKRALMVDFGSTFTKVTAVDLEACKLLGTAQSPTTAYEGIMSGLSSALEQLGLGRDAWDIKLACSSAAGGLKMAAVGLVPQLTAEAARLAALGAGAKVIKTYSYELSELESAEIEAIRPDIILLAGGTDGGNKEVLLANAGALSRIGLDIPVVVAGNKSVSPKAVDILRKAGKEAHLCENVMPELNKLHVEPVRQLVRSIFIDRIVAAKGFDEAKAFAGGTLVPTPSAVLEAVALLADGSGDLPGLGELMAVDVGGATTDIYSVALGFPSSSGVIRRGLEEPRVKRTVEGDLGVRYNAATLAESSGILRLADLSGLSPEDIQMMLEQLPSLAGGCPTEPKWQSLDGALAYEAVRLAAGRHAGIVEEVYTPMGFAFVQTGKDLTTVNIVVGSGGPIIHSTDPGFVLSAINYNNSEPNILKPKTPRLLLDRRYILSAMGLLAQVQPAASLHILMQELSEVYYRQEGWCCREAPQ